MTTHTPDKSGFPRSQRGTGRDGIWLVSASHRQPAWIVSEGGSVDRLVEIDIQVGRFAGFYTDLSGLTRLYAQHGITIESS